MPTSEKAAQRVPEKNAGLYSCTDGEDVSTQYVAFKHSCVADSTAFMNFFPPPRGDFCLGMLEKVPHLLPCKDSPEVCLLGVVLELRLESKATWVALASSCRLECCRRAESAVSVTVYS